MEPITGLTDTDLYLLNQLDDDTLVQFCKSTKYGKQLCGLPSIQNRIELYKKYKQFDILNTVDHVDDLVSRPYMFMTFGLYQMHFFMLYEQHTEIIDYYAVVGYDDKSNYDLDQFDVNQRFDVNDIVVHHMDHDFEYDIDTLWQIYTKSGLHHYATTAVVKKINDQFDFVSTFDTTTLDGFYDLLAIYYWFKIQCLFLNLTNEAFVARDVNISLNYIQSDYGVNIINRLKDEIVLYYDLMIDYINNK